MKIYSSREAKKEANSWQEKKDKYVARYNKKKAAYDEQYARYQTAQNEYKGNIINEINKLVGYDVTKVKWLSVDISRYHVRFQYNYDGGYCRTLRWEYDLELDSSGTLKSTPEFKADLTYYEGIDLNVLKTAYELLMSLQDIDWHDVVEKAKNNEPEYNKYVTEPYPGSLDTSRYDKHLKQANLSDFIGKDIWIRVRYREHSSKSYPEKYFIRMLSINDNKSYCKVNYANDYNNGQIPVPKRNYDRWYSSEKKNYGRKQLRVGGIEIIQPIETYTSEELFESPDEPAQS